MSRRRERVVEHGVLMPPSRRARLEALDGVRAVAAVSILVFHCWLYSSPEQLTWNLGPVTPFMKPLQSGVTLFFVLSGFLLYLPIVDRLAAGDRRPSTRRYLVRRSCRIFPAYWIVLSTAVALGCATAPGGVAGGLPLDVFLTDVFLLGNFVASSFGTGVLPAWSLSVEITFYAALPLLGLLAFRLARASQGRNWAVAAVAPAAFLIVLSTLVNIAATVFVPGFGDGVEGAWRVVLRQSFLSHGALFGVGMALAVAAASWRGDPRKVPSALLSARVGRALAYIGLPVLILGFYALPRWLYDAAVAIVAAVAIARLVAPRERSTRRRVLEHPWVAGAGVASYGVFLWHYPVLTFLHVHSILLEPAGAVAFVANLAMTATVTGVLSYLTYRYVERPAIAWSTQARATTRTAVPQPT